MCDSKIKFNKITDQKAYKMNMQNYSPSFSSSALLVAL